jgi:predicted HAD superfamily phosphohydrolase YqeG
MSKKSRRKARHAQAKQQNQATQAHIIGGNLMANVKATNQNVELLPIKEFALGKYQRATKTHQVNNIIKDFDEAKLGLLVVSTDEMVSIGCWMAHTVPPH